MAGFNIQGGIGNGNKNNVVESRRKHRFLFRLVGEMGPSECVYLKTASRPKFDFEEAIMHHDQEEAYFAGKQKWTGITFEWYDIQQNPDISAKLYAWLNIVNPSIKLTSGGCVNAPSIYKKQGNLQMTCGERNASDEEWDFYGMWPKQCDWQNLSYADGGAESICTIKVETRYDKAVKIK